MSLRNNQTSVDSNGNQSSLEFFFAVMTVPVLQLNELSLLFRVLRKNLGSMCGYRSFFILVFLLRFFFSLISRNVMFKPFCLIRELSVMLGKGRM